MLVATKGHTVDGNGLVVVGRTNVVIDAHFAIELIEGVVIHTHNLHVPSFFIWCGRKKVVNIKVPELRDPGFNQLLHRAHIIARELLAKVTIDNAFFCISSSGTGYNIGSRSGTCTRVENSVAHDKTLRYRVILHSRGRDSIVSQRIRQRLADCIFLHRVLAVCPCRNRQYLHRQQDEG